VNDPIPVSPAETTQGVPPVIALKRHRWRWLWWIGAPALAITLGLLFAYNPAHHSFYPFCTFHRVTGWQCPGCGGLRATHHLLHGDIVTAFRFNPLVVMALPIVAGFVLWRWQWARGGGPGIRAQARWGWAILVVLLVFWVVRNLPLEIFRMPAQ